MKRKTTLSSRASYASVKITIELDAKTIGRHTTQKVMDALTDACARAIADTPNTGAEYTHQIKIR